MTEKESEITEVLYNANCPVCRFEIAHYAAYSNKNALPVTFCDLNNQSQLNCWQLDSDTAAQRIHVRKDGQLLAGFPAFILIWRELPKYRWLARLFSLPGLHRLACLTYDYALAPIIYRWHIRRLSRQKGSL